ncbi:RNAPII degradation factor [Tieghemiomyces parasiticus]|uniref:RNA polymerase II degradation factor 1 n=1 Tax=Tieghemiomyces parasiticus TaxID=78921 RepID=A0A9W8AFX7_9FUNG|nr:RNAPII degradation factor [Tieghemiomyces parasiticus]
MSDRRSSSQAGQAARHTHTRRTKGTGNSMGRTPSGASEVSEAVQIRELRNKYVDKLVSLHELFPKWTDEDLLCTLEEAYGDLDIAIDRITQGYANQWGQVGMSKPKTDGTGATKRAGDERGKGNAAGKGNRGDKARPRGANPNPKSRPAGGRSGAPQAVRNDTAEAAREDRSLSNRAPRSRAQVPAQVPPTKTTAPSGAATATAHSSSSTSAPPPVAQPAPTGPIPSEPPKMTWAKILVGKDTRKPTAPVPAPVSESTEPQWPPMATASASAGWGADSLPEVEPAQQATGAWVATLETVEVEAIPDNEVLIVEETLEVPIEEPIPVPEAPVSPKTTHEEVAKEASPAPEAAPVSTEPQATPQPKDRALSPTPVATSTPPGFKRPSSQQRRLRQDAPVVMPFDNTAPGEGLDVQFGSLSVGGINFGYTEVEPTPANEQQPTAEPPKSVEPQAANTNTNAAGPASANPTAHHGLNGFPQAGAPGLGKDYPLYGADKSLNSTNTAPAPAATTTPSAPKPTAGPTHPQSNLYQYQPETAAQSHGGHQGGASGPAYGPPGLTGNYGARANKPAPQGGAEMGNAPLSNSFPPPGLQQPPQQQQQQQQPFQQGPYPGVPYYPYYYLPSGQFPNPGGYPQSNYGQPFMNKGGYPPYAGNHQGPNKVASTGPGAADGLSAAYPYGGINNPAGANLHFPSGGLSAPGYDDLGVSNFGQGGGIPQLQNILNASAGKGAANQGNSAPGLSAGNTQGGLKGSNGGSAGAAGNGHNAGPAQSAGPGGFANQGGYPGHPNSYQQQQSYHPFSHQQPQPTPFVPGQQMHSQYHYVAPQQPGYGSAPPHHPGSYNAHPGGYAPNQQHSGQHHYHGHQSGPSGPGSQGNQYHGSGQSGGSQGSGTAQYQSSGNTRGSQQSYWANQN